MLRHCSSVRSIKACRPPPPMPALAKQPSTRPKRSSVAAIGLLTEAGSVTSQMRLSTLPLQPTMVAAALLFFSALRPQIEMLHPAAASACAMPRPIPPLPPVMMATRPVRSKSRASVSMRRFHLVWRALRLRPGQADVLTPTMDKRALKIKYGIQIDPDASAVLTTRTTTDEETDAVQTRYARHRWAGRRPQARSSGGDERGIGRHAGRSRRGARQHRRQE